MPKKKKGKGKASDRDDIDAVGSSSEPTSDGSVCPCLELDLKHPTRRDSRGSESGEDTNSIDDKCAVLHWSDAHKLDIRDGEPALVIRAAASSELQSANSNGAIAVICKVRISPAAPDSRPSTTSSTPQTSKRKGSQDVANCGEVLVSPNHLYEHFYRSISDGAQAKTIPAATPKSLASPPPSAASVTKNATYTSPSKSGFSFSKGGGGDALISPSPSKYTSPSGSKFSFAKGGGGSAALSPTPTKPTNMLRKKRGPANVTVIPLMNLSPRQRSRLYPDAQKVTLCPIGSSIDTHLSSSKNIIETLVKSKYHGALLHTQTAIDTRHSDHTTINRDSAPSSTPETASISFRGQKETFRVVEVVPAAFDEIDGNERDDELADMFDRLDIASDPMDGRPAETLAQNETNLVQLLQFRLKQIQSESGIAYRITSRTTVGFVSSSNENQSAPSSSGTTPQATNVKQNQDTLCAGLDATLARVKDALLPPLLHPDLFPSDGPLRPPKGALLYGPAGVGKSLLAAQIAHDLSLEQKQKNVYTRLVQCADILSSTAIVGEAEKLLTDIFQQAERRALDSGGSLVILDDVHLICPRRGAAGGGGLGVDQLAGTLLALLDGIGSSDAEASKAANGSVPGNKSSGGLVVLAITTDPALLDPALRRPGRLDVEVEVPVPDDEARAVILSFHLSQLETKGPVNEADIKVLSRLAKGFTGADCKLAVKEAVRTAVARNLQPGSESEEAGGTGSSSVEYADLEHAIRITKPSAIKSVAVEVPKVPWSSIGGMDHVKAMLKESIELPLTHPHLFEMMQVPPPKGILLYGPPGCSKTLMARAIATEGQMNFLAVKGPELLSKWLGESERALASLFRRARLAAPAVIFFDEMDAIASKRGDSGGSGGDRLLSQLLTELDGVTSGGSGPVGKGGRVVVVGATNRPDVLDAALTRPGRMDRMIYVGLPDEQGRKSIFEIGLSGKDCHDDVDISAIASDEVSKGYSGAEIVALCKDAALHAIGEMDEGGIDRPQIHMRHLMQAIDDMKPRTTKEMLNFYASFRGRH